MRTQEASASSVIQNEIEEPKPHPWFVAQRHAKNLYFRLLRTRPKIDYSDGRVVWKAAQRIAKRLCKEDEAFKLFWETASEYRLRQVRRHVVKTAQYYLAKKP